MPDKKYSAKSLLLIFFYQVLFVECNTQQRLYRVQKSLCRAPKALGKEGESSYPNSSGKVLARDLIRSKLL
jgi:hypothetical protein